MTERERLIELIKKAKREELIDVLTADIDLAIDMPRGEEYIADHLLANGVIVPPCKVGDTVYINGCFGGVAEPHKIKFLSLTHDKNGISIFFEADLLDEDGNPTGSDCGFWDHYIGESVFPSREEAEKALAERSKE